MDKKYQVILLKVMLIQLQIKKIIFLDKTWLIRFKIKDKKFNKFIVEKASISINGVSLQFLKFK